MIKRRFTLSVFETLTNYVNVLFALAIHRFCPLAEAAAAWPWRVRALSRVFTDRFFFPLISSPKAAYTTWRYNIAFNRAAYTRYNILYRAMMCMILLWFLFGGRMRLVHKSNYDNIIYNWNVTATISYCRMNATRKKFCSFVEVPATDRTCIIIILYA